MTKEDLQTIRAETLGLSQTQFAEKLGMSQSAVSRLETGEVPIDKRTAMAVQVLVASKRPSRSQAAA